MDKTNLFDQKNNFYSNKKFFYEVKDSDINFAFSILCYLLDQSSYKLLNFIEFIEKKHFEKNDDITNNDNTENQSKIEKIENLNALKFLFFLIILSRISLKAGNTYISLDDIENKGFEFSIDENQQQKSYFTKKIIRNLSYNNSNAQETFYYIFDSRDTILSYIDFINKKKNIFENINFDTFCKKLFKVNEEYEESKKLELLQPPIFVFEGNEKFYFRRFYLYEALIAKNISERLKFPLNYKVQTEIDINCNTESLILSINSFLENFLGKLDVLQIEAVKNSLVNNFVLISGGPGTGKTYILSLIILAHIYILKLKPDQIITIAPTGKAAKRMSELLKENLEKFNNLIPTNIKESYKINLIKDDFNIEAITIHRFLGSSEYSLSVKYNRENPVPQKLIIIDEASMIDIPLMAKMLEAISITSKIILSGDANQLSSVEAGRVFADLKEYLIQTGCFKKNLIEFKKSYRFEKDSFAEKARVLLNNILSEKDTEKKNLNISNFVDFLEIEGRLINIDQEIIGKNGFFEIAEIKNKFLNKIKTIIGNVEILNENSIESKIENSETGKNKYLNKLYEINKNFKILSPLRLSIYGTYNINRSFAKFLKDIEFYESKVVEKFIPIIITKNNYQLNLFNGDIGFLIDEEQKTYAYFIDEFDKEQIKKYPISTLTDWEPAYCLTVHKSQGSEFDYIELILPENIEKYPFITLELIYTAITRARKDFTIFCSKKSLESALKNRTKRATGLFEKLKILN